MCPSGSSTGTNKQDPAELLADIFNLYKPAYDPPFRGASLRLAIVVKWHTICALAHQIHDEECSVLEKRVASGLEKRVADAVARFNALPPDERRRLHEAQKKSWVVGETMLAHPDLSRDAAEHLYDIATAG